MARTFKVKSIHKQMYPATYNFRDEEDGASGTDIDFADTATTGANTTLQIIDSEDGHRKVLELYDNDGAGFVDVFNLINDEEYGSIEFWMKTSNAFLDNTMTLRHVGTNILAFKIDEDKFQYYDGAFHDVGKVALDNIWYHIRIDFECTAGSYSGLAQYDWKIFIDGVEYGDYDFVNNEAHVDRIRFNTQTIDIGYYSYYDAISYSWDTDYNIGDNVFWRHYTDQDSDFESEDVGTQGTSISIIDQVDTAASFEIVPFFSEHKKVLRGYYSSAAGGYDLCTMPMTDAMSGWVSYWIRTTDAAIQTSLWIRDDNVFIGGVQIISDKFQYYGAGAAWTDLGLTATDDTWYHIFIQWYSDDTYDVWINNVLYQDGVASGNNLVDGIDQLYIRFYGAAYYSYFDAFSFSSTSGNERADNRIFDYNSTYTKTDITTDVKNVFYKNEIYKWREATLLSETSYENSEIFFQIYDINSKLAMEAEIKNRAQISKDYNYSLRDKNQDDLEHRSSNTFSAKKIHDPTDSTSILKVILPNVSEVDGDLILVDADTKTTTYSPTTQNYPDYMMLRDISDLADSVVIISATGKCYLDDDKASGTVLDLDTVADKDKMTAPPLVTDILENINYFEIFGAMNPDTGTRFYKIIDNVGDDKKKSWRYTNNEFRNQTDVDNYAAALNNRTTTIKNIKFTAQSLGTHNMGETINYKFVDALYNIPQANYYVIFEQIDFDANENIIILSEGMIEQSKYAAEYELPENYNDSYASQIYDTDIYPITLYLTPRGGATNYVNGGIEMNAVNEIAFCSFFTSPDIDTTRPITIYYSFFIAALAGDGAVNVTYNTYRRACDCTAAGASNVFLTSSDLSCTTAAKLTYETKTIIADKVYGATQYWIEVMLNDAPPADLILNTVSLEYYIKRSL